MVEIERMLRCEAKSALGVSYVGLTYHLRESSILRFRMIYLYRAFSAKEPYGQWFLGGKRPPWIVRILCPHFF